MSQLSDKKDQVVNEAKSAAKNIFSSLAGNAQSEAKGVIAKITAALALHPKTVIVVAFIAGLVLGVFVGSSGSKPALAGATAPHTAYNAAPRASWHEFVPFKDGGARGNG